MKRKLQVFVSSTYTDLLVERQAAVGAILKAGHIPAGMELFTAGDRSQMETIKQWIDESDVYMLILGGRYGSVEKSTNMGYTELEYDYATEQGKPLFAVVIEEQALELKVKNGGTTFIEKDNPRELSRFREKVLSNISSFFNDEKDIKLCVYESLADLSNRSELKGWVSSDQVIDTRPLLEEIRKLSEENLSLKDTLANLQQQTSRTKSIEKGPPKFEELGQMLTSVEIDVPADATGSGKGFSDTLLNLFYSMRDALINGVTNAAGTSAGEQFLYHNLCPKLQLHGLIENEKVAGARYRRSYVSRLGREFLAEFERRKHSIQKASKKPGSRSTNTAKAVAAE